MAARPRSRRLPLSKVALQVLPSLPRRGRGWLPPGRSLKLKSKRPSGASLHRTDEDLSACGRGRGAVRALLRLRARLGRRSPTHIVPATAMTTRARRRRRVGRAGSRRSRHRSGWRHAGRPDARGADHARASRRRALTVGRSGRAGYAASRADRRRSGRNLGGGYGRQRNQHGCGKKRGSHSTGQEVHSNLQDVGSNDVNNDSPRV